MTRHDLTPEQRSWVNSARNLIDWLEANPTLIPEFSHFRAVVYAKDPEDLAAKMRVLGPCEKHTTDWSIGAIRKFGEHAVDLFTERSNVCERIEVGEEEVEEEVSDADPIPEGARVVGTVVRQVIRRTVPKYEVKCPPSLLALEGPIGGDE